MSEQTHLTNIRQVLETRFDENELPRRKRRGIKSFREKRIAASREVSDPIWKNENPVKVAMRNSYASSSILPFFVDEGEAKQYLSRKMQENG
jgi:hypothetical protein